MGVVVSIDGELFEPEHAQVSVFDRGFLYGDSVFETLRTYGGRPFALAEHLSRLERSASLVFIELPVGREQWKQEIDAALGAANNPESYVRVTVTRGSGPLGLDPALARGPLRVVMVVPLVPPLLEQYERGIAVVSWRGNRHADEAGVVGAKVGNYLVSVLAMRAAKSAGASEALVLDVAGRVLEGASSNVFLVKDGVVVTPPVEAGILPGITRQELVWICEDANIPVRFRSFELQELHHADEVFISSSIRELLPVVRVDDVRIGAGIPGPVTRDLLRRFRTRVGAVQR